MLTLVPGGMGGSEVYARSLCRALAAAGVDAVALVPPGAEDAGEGLPTEVVAEYAAGVSLLGKARALASARLRATAVRRRYRGLDVVHYPFTVPVPRLALPSVLTLHDLQHRDLPQLVSRGRRAFRRVAYDRASRGAHAVIVPTAFVRDRALALLGLDERRLHVVPHGVDHGLFRPAAAEREPFLLYPARTWPHKNHATLLDAFARLRRERPELRLVLTGAGTEALTGAGVDGRGAVPLDELVSLYQRAACLVFPSLYEGFGAPPLEAMACGTPVAAARAGSLPEVCGDAAVLFDPRDADDVARGVLEALERREELVAAGLDRAGRFTWAASVAGHLRAWSAASVHDRQTVRR